MSKVSPVVDSTQLTVDISGLPCAPELVVAWRQSHYHKVATPTAVLQIALVFLKLKVMTLAFKIKSGAHGAGQHLRGAILLPERI